MFKKKRVIFPVQRSVLSTDELLRETSQRYGLDDVTQCELLSIGLNDHYRLYGAGDDYIIRAYRTGFRTQEEILWEVTLLDHLKQSEASVASALKTTSGSWYCIVYVPEGLRHVVLFEEAPGRPPKPDAYSQQHARAYGRALAAVHDATNAYASRHERFTLDLAYLLGGPLQALWGRLSHRTEDLKYVRQLIDRVRDTIVEMDNQGLSRGVCHGDAHGRNGNINDNGEVTLYGFNFAAQGWRAYDLATFRWAMLKQPNKLQATANWDAFLEGYREVRNLSRADEQASTPFVAVREIWQMGLHSATGNDTGFAHMDQHYFDRSLEFLRSWDKEMLA